MIGVLHGVFGFLVVAFCSYLYIDAKNALLQVQLEIPHVKRELKEIVEENKRLAFLIQSFESPQHLVELSRQTEFAHLRPASIGEVLIISPKKEEVK